MRYAISFALSIVVLTIGALAAFDRITLPIATPAVVDTLASATYADTLPTREVSTPAVPTAADYAKFADADRKWRAANARIYTIEELRVRGDGKRSDREVVQDRVFSL